ncbi:MAG: hypothetical protein ACQESN_05715, partial [Thermotogota bacterium]
AFKKEFKDYVDIYKKDESQLKLNYDINKFKTKLNENIARSFINQGYNSHDIMKTLDKIDFSQNKNLVQQFIFIIVNEVISELLKDKDIIKTSDKSILKKLREFNVDSFITKDYFKKTIEEYLNKIFTKEHFKYFKKTPYLLNFAEPKTKFNILVNLKNISKLTPKRIDKSIDDFIINLEINKKTTVDLDDLIKYKTKIQKLFEKYDLSNIHETSNNFFDYFKSVLNF